VETSISRGNAWVLQRHRLESREYKLSALTSDVDAGTWWATQRDRDPNTAPFETRLERVESVSDPVFGWLPGVSFEGLDQLPLARADVDGHVGFGLDANEAHWNALTTAITRRMPLEPVTNQWLEPLESRAVHLESQAVPVVSDNPLEWLRLGLGASLQRTWMQRLDRALQRVRPDAELAWLLEQHPGAVVFDLYDPRFPWLAMAVSVRDLELSFASGADRVSARRQAVLNAVAGQYVTLDAFAAPISDGPSPEPTQAPPSVTALLEAVRAAGMRLLVQPWFEEPAVTNAGLLAGWVIADDD
jgi:hypothetical protein